MSFIIEAEQNNRILFLDVNDIPEQSKFTTKFIKKQLDSLFDPIPQILTSCVVYKFKCGICNESCYREL